MTFETALVLTDGRSLRVAGCLPVLHDRLLVAAAEGRTVLVRLTDGRLAPLRPGAVRFAEELRCL